MPFRSQRALPERLKSNRLPDGDFSLQRSDRLGSRGGDRISQNTGLIGQCQADGIASGPVRVAIHVVVCRILPVVNG